MKYINKNNLNAGAAKLDADLGVFSKFQENSDALGATDAPTRVKARPQYKIRPRPAQIYEYMQTIATCEKLVDSLRQKSLFAGFPFDQLYATVLDAYRNIIHGFIGRPRTA
jgi:hypothetical protein